MQLFVEIETFCPPSIFKPTTPLPLWNHSLTRSDRQPLTWRWIISRRGRTRHFFRLQRLCVKWGEKWRVRGAN